MSGHIHPGTIPETVGMAEEIEINLPPINRTGSAFESKELNDPNPAISEAMSEGRYKTLEFTSENAGIGLDITDIEVQYCSVCAIPLFISDAPWDVLPRRTVDGAYVFETARWEKKFMIKPSTKGPTVIKREKGAEVQHRFVCEECEMIIGYTIEPLSNDDGKKEPIYYYVFPDAFVNKPHLSDFAKVQ